MQRYARTSNNERISALAASAQTNYFCPECSGIVRVKRGEQRQAHFFHLSEGTACRIRLKNALHKAVQDWLIENLKPEECTEECYFPEISRIADVAYHKKQVVFEVQLSPISATEAVQRTADYYRIGWHVIWIIHAHTFGRYVASEFEEILTLIPHYFTDIGYRGGRLWDEGSFVHKGHRYWLSIPPMRRFITYLQIDLLHTPVLATLKTQTYENRRESWSCHLKGDLFDDQEMPKQKQDFSVCTTLRHFAYQLYFWYLHLVS